MQHRFRAAAWNAPHAMRRARAEAIYQYIMGPLMEMLSRLFNCAAAKLQARTADVRPITARDVGCGGPRKIQGHST